MGLSRTLLSLRSVDPLKVANLLLASSISCLTLATASFSIAAFLDRVLRERPPRYSHELFDHDSIKALFKMLKGHSRGRRTNDRHKASIRKRHRQSTLASA